MTNPFIEKLAKVVWYQTKPCLAEAGLPSNDMIEPPWEGLSESEREYCRCIVRAILIAMREPSEEMIAAANRGALKNGDATHVDRFQAMIDAALKDETT